MEQEVDRAELLLRPVHDAGDLVVARHVHGHEELGVGLGVGEQGDAAAIPLPFVVGAVGEVGEADLAALGHDDLGDRPGDRVIVGHAEHEPLHPVEPAHRVVSGSELHQPNRGRTAAPRAGIGGRNVPAGLKTLQRGLAESQRRASGPTLVGTECRG